MKKVKAKIERTVVNVATITIDDSGNPVEVLEVHEELEDTGVIEILQVLDIISNL
jgi:hypothetical protein